MADESAQSPADGSAQLINYSPQPDGCQLKCVFRPDGVTLIDEPPTIPGARRHRRKPTILTISDGRLTVSRPGESELAPFRWLRERHIRQMRVIPPRFFGLLCGSSLRIYVSNLAVDLFQGLSVAELTWAAHTIRFELQKYAQRRHSV